jgi:5-methyltetrahydrofolate--homocysteine methyltransferase
MNALINQLIANKPVLTDGAWGTQLQERGLPIGGCPDAWNLTNPEKVEEVARAYVEAGSRVILTNTFGANRFTLERHGLADRVAEVNRQGAEISRRAAGNSVKVFASIGPTGRMLAMGEIKAEDVRLAFSEQAQALAGGGADAMVVESMTDLEEAKLAVGAAKETGLPVVACIVFGAGKSGDRTIMGVTPERVVEELSAAGADAVGSNCGIGPAAMLPICQRMRAATDLPVWIKPNAGLPELVEGRAVYTTTPEVFAEEARALVSAGADFIGGCCGTSPLFIRALAQAFGR